MASSEAILCSYSCYLGVPSSVSEDPFSQRQFSLTLVPGHFSVGNVVHFECTSLSDDQKQIVSLPSLESSHIDFFREASEGNKVFWEYRKRLTSHEHTSSLYNQYALDIIFSNIVSLRPLGTQFSFGLQATPNHDAMLLRDPITTFALHVHYSGATERTSDSIPPSSSVQLLFVVSESDYQTLSVRILSLISTHPTHTNSASSLPLDNLRSSMPPDESEASTSPPVSTLTITSTTTNTPNNTTITSTSSTTPSASHSTFEATSPSTTAKLDPPSQATLPQPHFFDQHLVRADALAYTWFEPFQHPSSSSSSANRTPTSSAATHNSSSSFSSSSNSAHSSNRFLTANVNQRLFADSTVTRIIRGSTAFESFIKG